MITLPQAVKIMNQIKDTDFDDELEIYLESYPEPHFVIKERLIKMEVKNGN